MMSSSNSGDDTDRALLRDNRIVEIPSPAGLPLLGNTHQIETELPLRSFLRLADQYGEIFRLRFLNRSQVFVTTQELVNEACDERRFHKAITPILGHVRNGTNDGLFTAEHGSETWGIAHRVLVPAFGPRPISSMFDEMHDIATQLVLKWARRGPDAAIMVTDDFTRLALDTLALCSMGYRFNSFYSEELHPFVAAMGDFLVESGERSRRPPLPAFVYRARDRKYEADIETMRSTAREVLEARRDRAVGADRHDLLAAMLEGVDRHRTGAKMTDESIMDNLITFLIAGHETTAGMLSFACYNLIRSPEAFRRAQAEVDDVIGAGPVRIDHLSQLRYLAAVLRETLRLSPTIAAFAVQPKDDTVIGGGRYQVRAGETITLLLAKLHRDPAVYGSDAAEFRPERMLDEPFQERSRQFPNSFKPFGSGARGCIGQPFAWQEGLAIMAMLLQNFNFAMHDPNYQLEVRQTLTIKPKDFYMRAILRPGLTATIVEKRISGQAGPAEQQQKEEDDKDATAAAAEASAVSSGAVSLTILYGSNSGTCETMAQRIATDAPAHGFAVAKLDCLDSANGSLPAAGDGGSPRHPVVVITASYEGEPPDNAGHFVAWVEGLKIDKELPLRGVDYALFGCGHKDWAATFHRVPRRVDAALERAGARRIAATGLADASRSDLFSVFEAWEFDVLWPALTRGHQEADPDGSTPTTLPMTVSVVHPRTSALRQNVQPAVVVAAESLSTGPADRAKRHLELRLPEDMTYAAGDYLAVLPLNPAESVHRAMRRLGLSRDSHLVIKADGRQRPGPAAAAGMPLGVEGGVSAAEILGSYVELAQVATRRNVLALAEAAAAKGDDPTRAELSRLAGDGYDAEIAARRVSVLDLLERFPAVDLSVGAFLSMMPPMRSRQYSISSSPLRGDQPGRATLTFSLLRLPSLADVGRAHIGVASSYLASLGPGDVAHVAVRPSPAAFHLPADPEGTPIVCIAAGTGIAPFRAFVEERSAMMAAGRGPLAPMLLFFGCRSRDEDLYRAELDEWEQQGAVSVRRAYSRAGTDAERQESAGCRYAQDRLWHDRAEATELWKAGAKVFTCGARAVADAARDVMVRMMMESSGSDEQKAAKWFAGLQNVRYAADVFD